MIRSLVLAQWIQLRRDRAALISIFFLPVAFFSVSAVVFGGMAERDDPGKVVRALVGDQDRSALSAGLVTLLRAHSGEALEVVSADDSGRAHIDAQIRNGRAPVALIIGAGFEQALRRREFNDLGLDIVYDGANPIARYILNAAMQNAILRLLMQTTSDTSDSSTAGAVLPDAGAGASPWDIAAVKLVDVRPGEEGVVLYFAAGIAVMFLLFSSSRAGGALLEERDDGTLERVLNTRADMHTLIVAKWCFFTLQGIAQIATMFVWAVVVFDADIFGTNRLVGVAVMTVVTAAAASGFGVILATLFRSRAQLYGISTIVILVMSALGGSMAPRFIMPPFMETVALFTFNGWALDGYLKVFWYNEPSWGLVESLLALGPQVAMLSFLTVAFLVVARTLARRWEVD